jgi:hypothetical protein
VSLASGATVSVPGVSTAANQTAANTALESIDTKLANNATSTLQETGNTTLASILAKIIAAPATAALQTTLNNAVTAFSAKFSALGQQTIANSVSIVPATDAIVPVSSTTLATAVNQTASNLSLTNLVAATCTGLSVGGTADNAAITGVIAAPGADKAILVKSLTFSIGVSPSDERVLTLASGGNDIVNFAVTSAGAGFVPIGVAAPVNSAVAYSFSASGTAGAISRFLIYYSIVDA